jgi:hypothetical protein
MSAAVGVPHAARDGASGAANDKGMSFLLKNSYGMFNRVPTNRKPSLAPSIIAIPINENSLGSGLARSITVIPISENSVG